MTSVIRKSLFAGTLDDRRARLALMDVANLRVHRVPHQPLLARIWELRANVTPYGASYIALAERLGAVLVTADERLARAPGTRCTVELLSRG